MASFSDDFNRSDEALTASSDWDAWLDGSCDIDSNEVISGGFDPDNYGNFVATGTATFDADGEAEVEIAVLNSFEFFGPAYRCSGTGGSSDGYTVEIDSSGNLDLYEISSGSFSFLDSDSTGLSVGDKVKILCDGTTISVEVDTGSGFSEVISDTDSNHSSGQPGIYHYNENTLSAALDNFSAEDAVTLARELEGFRFRDDDGSETTASWLAAQDTDITRAKETTTRLRFLLNYTGDPDSEQIKMQYQKNGDSDQWEDIS